MRPRLLVVCLLCLAPATAAAQERSRLAPSTRVRVHAPSVSGSVLIGSVLGVVGDTLMLRPQETELALRIPFAAVERLEVSDPRRQDRFARIGALVGGTAGVVAAVTGAGRDCGECTAADRIVVAIPVGLLGAGIGGILGTVVAGEDWQPVPVPGSEARAGSGLP